MLTDFYNQNDKIYIYNDLNQDFYISPIFSHLFLHYRIFFDRNLHVHKIEKSTFYKIF